MPGFASSPKRQGRGQRCNTRCLKRLANALRFATTHVKKRKR